MRTEGAILQFLGTLGISEGVYKRDGYLTTTLRYGDHRRLLDWGVMSGFGDAFEYGGMGVVVVGHSGVGKTALVREMADSGAASVLAEDELLLYAPDCGRSFTVCQYPYLETDSWADTIARYAGFLSQSEAPCLGAVLVLNAEDVSESEGLVPGDPNLFRKFFHTWPVGRTPHGCETEVRRFEGVQFLEYRKGYGYTDRQHVRATARRIREAMDQIMYGSATCQKGQVVGVGGYVMPDLVSCSSRPPSRNLSAPQEILDL